MLPQKKYCFDKLLHLNSAIGSCDLKLKWHCEIQELSDFQMSTAAEGYDKKCYRCIKSAPVKVVFKKVSLLSNFADDMGV